MNSLRRKIRDYVKEKAQPTFRDLRFGNAGVSDILENEPTLVIHTPKQPYKHVGYPKYYDIETKLVCEIIAWEKENILDELDFLAQRLTDILLSDHSMGGLVIDINIEDVECETKTDGEKVLGSIRLFFRIDSHVSFVSPEPSRYSIGEVNLV